ncbi:MAG TPA: DUF2339 domain-containing protein, partial [Armatimonadota bacterium]|nr:DUF2339 domain-containing protein [Armatimonadota bacterium]
GEALGLALGALTRRRVPADRLAVFGFLLLAAAFATLAVPLALRGDAVLLAWTMEAPVLLLLGYRYRDLPLRIGSGLVLVLALLRLFGTHGPLHPEAVSFTPFLNGPFLTALAVPAAAGVLALLHAWWAGSADRTETDDVLRLAAGTGGALLALLLVQLELLQWLTGIGHPEVTHYASALVWGTGGLLFVLLGLHRTHRALVVVGTLLLVLACGFAAFTFSNGVAYALPVLNPRFGLIALVLVYGFLAWRAAYRRQAAVAWQQAFFGLFEGAALLLVSLEAVMNVGASVNPEHARWLAQLNLTLTWAVVASVQLIAGFRRRSRGLRLAGLALFGATAVKLLLIDLAVLEQIYRILAFFIVGLLMVGAGYLYQRWEQALREDAAAHCADDGR